MDTPISAGDVGRFAYCPLNWKLSLEGTKGEGGKAGIKRHAEVAEQVDALEYHQTQLRFTLQVALWMALFATSAAALGVEVFALDRSLTVYWFLVFASVLWMAASLYLLVFHLYYQSRAEGLVSSTKLAAGQVVFSDSKRHDQMFQSRILPLRGRPDYVVERGGVMIPVELKTGATPPKPYDSHVLQLAAYCYLVNEAYGKRPPIGVLSYPERQFEIPYTDDLENRLAKTLLRIKLAQKTGEVHRDHNNPRRCASCSRRAGCPERLA